MTQSPPARTEQSYRHEAFLWHDRSDYTNSLVPFITDGLEAREPVLVAVLEEHSQWLRDALGPKSDEVRFVDITALGNPGKIIPAVHTFLDTEAGGSGPARAVGEPIWPGRDADELIECQLNEALLNVAVDPTIPFWLICSYDADRLEPAVIDEAYRSHPVVMEADTYKGSTSYAGRAHLEAMLGKELPPLAGEPTTIPFGRHNLHRLHAFIKLEGHVAGLRVQQAADLATITQRLAADSLGRGASSGTIRVWRQPRSVVCEVVDDTHLSDPLAGRRTPLVDDADALWAANQLCDLVQVRTTPNGTTVRVHSYR